MILIYLVVQVYGAIITYDTNLFTGFDYKVDAAFVCASATFTKSVTFSGTFANVPKVILTFDRFDLSSSTNFELSITSTTTTGIIKYYFKLQVSLYILIVLVLIVLIVF